MTPPAAATAAARSPHRVRRSPAPAGPRRVSGPARRSQRDPRQVADARLRAATAPALAPPLHGRGRQPGLATGVGVLALPGRGVRAAVRTLPEPGGVLDRLLRSRAWIGVVAGLLIGLVFLQVSLLKVNAGIGRSVQTASGLQRSNDALRSQNALLRETQRISSEAARAGMIAPTADQVRYLRAGSAGGVGGAGGAALAADATDTSGDTTMADGSTDTAGDTAATDGSTDTSAADTSSQDTGGTYDTAGTDSSGSSDTGSTDTSASTDTSSSGSTDAASTGGAGIG